MRTRSSAETAQEESLWATTTDEMNFPRLDRSIQVDVAIVGAGIAGLSCAYALLKAGKSVAVLDDGPIAGGMTQVTTAHLSNAIDDRYHEIERMHGERGARLAAESHTAAIHRIESIVKVEKIDCDFSRLDGYLFLTEGEDPEILTKELAAAHRAGLADVDLVEQVEQLARLGPALRFPMQGQFHPLRYLHGLARILQNDGCQIFTDSHVDHLEGGKNAHVKVGSHHVKAEALIVATNVPVNDLFAIHTKQAPYMTYAIGVRVPQGAIPASLYWDTGAVSNEGRGAAYHYVRLQKGKNGSDILIVGGEDHKSGQADDTDQRHRRLEEWARERFPMIEDVEFVWGGQVMETVDGLAFIGRNPGDDDNVYIVTGDSGMGMTHGTIAGILIPDLILGRDNPWASLYDPARKTLSALGRFTSESLNVAAQYTDWLTGSDVKSIDEIPVDSGAVMRRGLSKVAVYRDEKGTLHEHSAVCNHLGCIVQWNRAEKSWDCPCHGSRFTSLGKVINGPANQDLESVKKA